MADPRLSEIAERLERAAGELRDTEGDGRRVAQLVEECARLAGEAAAALDREARAADAIAAGDADQLALGD